MSEIINERRLRVLHVGKYYPPHPGGMESHLQVLCQELKKFVDVEVLVASDESKTVEEVIDGIKVTRLSTPLNFQAAPVCPQMVRKIRESRADVVHLHWPNPTAVLAYLASRHPGRLVFTYHSDIVRQKMLSRAFWPFLRQALKRADAVIVASPNYRDSSKVLAGFRERCRVIPFGISPDYFQQVDSEDVASLRRQYGSRLILGVGRFVYYKGFEYLIRAMKGVDGRLLLIGNGPLREKLAREALESGVSDKVTFLLDVKDVRPFYQAADVFVLPSIARSEAFGIVQLEAMACGKPVVNTSLDSGVTFVSPHGVSGLTVQPANPTALSEAINALLDNPTLRDEYGRAGKRRITEMFCVDVMARDTLRVYGEIMNQGARLEKSCAAAQGLSLVE
jgi:glycosyltransferase involved in cell wall biosynthesis